MSCLPASIIFWTSARFALILSWATCGRLVSIDIHTSDYEVGDSLLETVERLQARRPDAEVWTERIGYNAVHAVGGSLRRVDR